MAIREWSRTHRLCIRQVLLEQPLGLSVGFCVQHKELHRVRNDAARATCKKSEGARGVKFPVVPILIAVCCLSPVSTHTLIPACSHQMPPPTYPTNNTLNARDHTHRAMWELIRTLRKEERASGTFSCNLSSMALKVSIDKLIYECDEPVAPERTRSRSIRAAAASIFSLRFTKAD